MTRNVVVTGSSSGIGRAIALAFAREHDSVLFHGFRNREGLRLTRAEAEQNRSDGQFFETVIADVSSEDGCNSLIDAAYRWKPRIDIWINAAGANVLTGELSKSSFDEKLNVLWQTDVLGCIRMSRKVSERMSSAESAQTLPHIINITWDQAAEGMEGESGQYFATTKSAIAAFTKSLAKSVGPAVRVNAVAPGWIKTEWGNDAPPEWQHRATGESMLHRWGTPEDVANVVLAISSHQCEFINGQDIAVNGGWKPSY